MSMYEEDWFGPKTGLLAGPRVNAAIGGEAQDDLRVIQNMQNVAKEMQLPTEDITWMQPRSSLRNDMQGPRDLIPLGPTITDENLPDLPLRGGGPLSNMQTTDPSMGDLFQLAKAPRRPPIRNAPENDSSDLPSRPGFGSRPIKPPPFARPHIYDRGYAEGQPMPNANPYTTATLGSLQQNTTPRPRHPLEYQDENRIWTDPLPPEFRPQQELSLPDIIQRFSVAPGGSF